MQKKYYKSANWNMLSFSNSKYFKNYEQIRLGILVQNLIGANHSLPNKQLLLIHYSIHQICSRYKRLSLCSSLNQPIQFQNRFFFNQYNLYLMSQQPQELAVPDQDHENKTIPPQQDQEEEQMKESSQYFSASIGSIRNSLHPEEPQNENLIQLAPLEEEHMSQDEQEDLSSHKSQRRSERLANKRQSKVTKWKGITKMYLKKEISKCASKKQTFPATSSKKKIQNKNLMQEEAEKVEVQKAEKVEVQEVEKVEVQEAEKVEVQEAEQMEEEAEDSKNNDPDRRSVCVQNLNHSLTEKDLQELFESCGKIKRVTILKTKTRKSKGYAFIQFQKQSSVNSALILNGKTVRGQDLRISPKRKNIHNFYKKKSPQRHPGNQFVSSESVVKFFNAILFTQENRK